MADRSDADPGTALGGGCAGAAGAAPAGRLGFGAPGGRDRPDGTNRASSTEAPSPTSTAANVARVITIHRRRAGGGRSATGWGAATATGVACSWVGVLGAGARAASRAATSSATRSRIVLGRCAGSRDRQRSAICSSGTGTAAPCIDIGVGGDPITSSSNAGKVSPAKGSCPVSN
jgi:hypothetical protein